MRILTIAISILALAGIANAQLLAVDCEPAANHGTQAGFDSMVCSGLIPETFVTSGGQTVTLTATTDQGTATPSASNKGSKDPANGFPRNLAMYDMFRNNADQWGVLPNGDIPVIEVDISGLQPETEYPLLVGSLSVYRELFQLVRPARGTTGPVLTSQDTIFPVVLGDNEVEGNYTTTAAGVLSVDVVFDEAAALAWRVSNPGATVDTQAVISYLMIPEPMTLSLLALGGLMAIRRRRS